MRAEHKWNEVFWGNGEKGYGEKGNGEKRNENRGQRMENGKIRSSVILIGLCRLDLIKGT